MFVCKNGSQRVDDQRYAIKLLQVIGIWCTDYLASSSRVVEGSGLWIFKVSIERYTKKKKITNIFGTSPEKGLEAIHG